MMAAKVVKEGKFGIAVNKMADGDVAVIVSWCGVGGDEIGCVVQRYGDALIVIGERSGMGWSDVDQPYPDCMVRILRPGTQIEL